MAEFQVTVDDIATRSEIIEQKCSPSPQLRTQRFFAHAQAGDDLPVIELDIGIPLYRMANYRTQTHQRKFIHEHDFSSEYFSKGEENVASQKSQHLILVDFSKQGSGESIQPIRSLLADVATQTEPLLVTKKGVVVNGNRRLAAMRDLYAEDPARYSFFRQISVMVLPEVTDDDIRRIEVRLQMRPETKLPYDWTNNALAVRDLRQRGMELNEVASLMQLNNAQDVQSIITRLEEGECYLSDYLDKPEEYEEIESQEQQFLELQKALNKKTDPIEKEISRKLCHIITRHSRQMGTRAYDFKDAYGNDTLKVASRMAEKRNITIRTCTRSHDIADTRV